MRLTYPYKWEDRKVLLQDGVLFIPDQIEEYPPVDLSFFSGNPIFIEYCSGNGAWIIEKALERPDINWIAIEKKFDRVGKIWKKAKKLGLKNLLIIYGEGINATIRYFKEASIQEVFVNFPDPWPKKRHWKHRIINQVFLGEMQRILTLDGKVTFVTDDVEYSKVMEEELRVSRKFSPLHPAPLNELPGYGSSYFEELWRSKGKPIFYHRWCMT